MSKVDIILLFWVVPALVTFLLIIQWERSDSKKPESWTFNDWMPVIGFSFIYPVGLILIFVSVVWPQLIKERSFTKKD